MYFLMLKLEEAENENDVDPLCVPGKPTKITFADITSAAFKVKLGITCTPCIVSTFLTPLDMAGS